MHRVPHLADEERMHAVSSLPDGGISGVGEVLRRQAQREGGGMKFVLSNDLPSVRDWIKSMREKTITRVVDGGESRELATTGDPIPAIETAIIDPKRINQFIDQEGGGTRMKPGVPQHISTHRERIEAATIASGLLVSRQEIDVPTRQALEQVMFQRETRVDVLEWTQAVAARVSGREVLA